MTTTLPPYVLIVEDSGQLALMISGVLRQLGIESELLGSVTAVRRRFHSLRRIPNVIITDFHLVGVETGLDLARWWGQEHPPAPPMILFTGNRPSAMQAAAALDDRLETYFAAVIDKRSESDVIQGELRAALVTTIEASFLPRLAPEP